MKKNILLIALLTVNVILSQEIKVKSITVDNEINIDGILNEKVWSEADSILLLMVEPYESAKPSFSTSVRILMSSSNLIIGVMCYDQEPAKIISYSKIRDASLGAEDRIKFVLDTYRNKRSGYIFAINPDGTRYDALVSSFGESENPDWDGIWTAKTNIDSNGWSAEILIPIKTLSFSSNLKSWGFNIERRIQRNLEIDRWTGLKRDYKVGQVVHAGNLSNIPDFNLGIGLLSKISGIAQSTKFYNQNSVSELDYSLDFTQKFTSEITGQLTVNTDFAETEVDSRETNLTRFPLFFPEKRNFFLEGTDIFDFGIGLGSDIIPFYSRKIGLYKGNKVPIIAGLKLNGRVNSTNFGALTARTDNVNGIVPASTMGVFRIKQNILNESSFGIIGTFGDPSGKNDNWLLGSDFVYQNSEFLGDKNFLFGIWGIYNNNPLLIGDKSAIGLKADYPNDLLDVALTIKRIGDAFNPSLGFVPRKGVVMYSFGADYMPRPEWLSIRQFYFESSFSLVTNLNNNWESWRIFTAPIHFLLESGDRFEFNIAPQGENLFEDFEIEDGIVISKGAYDWMRYRVELETASKRLINGQITYWFGSFYDGSLDQIEIEMNLRPFSNLNLGLSYERNIGQLTAGDFDQTLFGGRIQYSFSPAFEFTSFIQYDNESKSIGTNNRLRWNFSMLGDLFVVYNHNVKRIEERYWQYESNQLIIKFSYGFWL
jgi:hypothetical protein